VRLRGAILSGASLNDTNLNHAKLTGAKLTSAKLTSADLNDAKLHGVRYSPETVWPLDYSPLAAVPDITRRPRSVSSRSFRQALQRHAEA
jgi:uncharacterized protein YjbI with pentapeptide repeats